MIICLFGVYLWLFLFWFFFLETIKRREFIKQQCEGIFNFQFKQAVVAFFFSLSIENLISVSNVDLKKNDERGEFIYNFESGSKDASLWFNFICSFAHQSNKFIVINLSSKNIDQRGWKWEDVYNEDWKIYYMLSQGGQGELLAYASRLISHFFNLLPLHHHALEYLN